MGHPSDLEAAVREAAVEVAAVAANMRRLGREADAISDVPAALFDGIDVRRLNRSYLPPEFGGHPVLQDGVARCVVGEALGRADAALAVALPGPSLALPAVLGFGSDEQRRDLFRRFDSAAPVWAAFAMTEPSGGSDAMQVETTAVPDGGGYRLNGAKCLIGNAGRASFVVVFAATDPERGRFGVHPFVVDRGTPGLSIDDARPMLGLRAVRVAEIRLEDCWVPADRLLGEAHGRAGAAAFLSAQRTWEHWRPALSALMVGAVARLLDDLELLAAEAGDTCLRRDADALVDRTRRRLDSVRLLVHHAAALFDAGDDSSVASSMAKAAAARLARGAVADADAAVRAAGLGSHDVALDIERWGRDFQAFELLEGTTEMHQLMITRGWAAQLRRGRRRPRQTARA